MATHTGGCHCGRVRFEVIAPRVLSVTDCNCSVCSKSGYLHLIVPKSGFRLLSGEDALTTYQFNTRTARHMFCSVCGIKAFYVPRSHPDGYSVNARCLEEGTVEQMKVIFSDGKNWERTHLTEKGESLESAVDQQPGDRDGQSAGARGLERSNPLQLYLSDPDGYVLCA